jgi:DUF971 family protein
MKPDPRTQPTQIKAPHGSRTLEIRWADGHRGVYPHEILRGYCPCATCQGHGSSIKFIAGAPEQPSRYLPGGDLEIKGIEQVGNYALKFEWGDTHDTGIYSFPFLRLLCQCDECKPEGDDKTARPVLPRI